MRFLRGEIGAPNRDSQRATTMPVLAHTALIEAPLVTPASTTRAWPVP
jgi:hypothetical protein